MAGINWNPALEALPFSPIRRMFNTAATMDNVLHLSIGQPDFPTPPHIIEAQVRALREGKTRYELDSGLPHLREAVASFYSGHYGITLRSENVLITTGCCEGMFIALFGACRPGAEIIVVEPYFVLAHIAEMAGATLRPVVTTAANGYQVDPQEVIDAMNDKTAAILMNSPGNPTGTVYPRATMAAVCDAAARRGITLISDEVYDRIILDEGCFASALTCAPTMDNLIMASSVSKTYSMAGLRIGWVISTRENIETMQRAHMFISTAENTPAQWAAVTALTEDQDYVDEMVAEYRRRRDRIVDLVDAAPQFTGYRPGGAFFIMPSLPPGADSFDVAMRLLTEAGVCTIPGGAFGPSCNNALRISFATSTEIIEAAFERMNPWLEKQSF